MEDYILQQGPSAYKRPRLGDSIQASNSFMDARSNMVPFGFIGTQERDADMNMAAMSMGGNLAALNPAQDFGQLAAPDWRHGVTFDSRLRFIHKIDLMRTRYTEEMEASLLAAAAALLRTGAQSLLQNVRNGDHSDNRSKWLNTQAKKIESRAFKTAVSRLQYLDMIKEEIHKLHVECGFPAMSSQFLPSSSTTSSATSNNIPLVNMPQNYGPNSFAVTATQSHSQPGIAHSATSVNLFTDESVGGSMRIPVTSSLGSARHHLPAFNDRPPGPRSMVHDQVSGNALSIGDPSQLMPNADQVLGPNLLHSMNTFIPLSQFVPSSAVGSQQRFGLNDAGQGVLSENSSVINSQGSGRMQSKEWHKSVTFNLRNSLIRKMAQLLSSIPDPQAANAESRMHNCITIATSVENETYRTANSMSQYYDLMAKRCHYITKERSSATQPGMQYFNHSDIRRTYEALGIAYPVGQTPFPTGNSNNGRLHEAPPPPGVMPNIIGPGVPPPYCTAFARGQAAAAVQANHNQLLGTENNSEIQYLGTENNGDIRYLCTENNNAVRYLNTEITDFASAVPLSLDASDVPDVIKQLAHSYKCMERENQENDVMLLCSLPHCRETKDLLNHISTCQLGITCCGSTKEIIDHWNRCTLSDCTICLPLRQAERNLNSTVAISTNSSNPMAPNPFLRRPHRLPGSNYPSTATSGLLSNQSQNGPSIPGRNERVSPRSSMWHSNYGDNNWRSSGSDMSMDRRNQRGFWMYNRNVGNNRHDRRVPYGLPWAGPDIILVDAQRGGPQPPRGASLFGPIGSYRNVDRLQPYGAPWRSPDILLVENVRPAHRQAQDSDEPVIIPPEEDATPSEHQQMMAIVKVVKTAGGRLEQKYRCSRRSCSAAWPCLHRRLAASIQSMKTPIPA